MDYGEGAELAKVLADETRLKIVDMLSCGELCACDLLDHLEISQPTLSYHMKSLCSSGLVTVTRRGQWAHYTLDKARFREFATYLDALFNDKDDCVCHRSPRSDC